VALRESAVSRLEAQVISLKKSEAELQRRVAELQSAHDKAAARVDASQAALTCAPWPGLPYTSMHPLQLCPLCVCLLENVGGYGSVCGEVNNIGNLNFPEICRLFIF
jgi:hypothetical protein